MEVFAIIAACFICNIEVSTTIRTFLIMVDMILLSFATVLVRSVKEHEDPYGEYKKNITKALNASSNADSSQGEKEDSLSKLHFNNIAMTTKYFDISIAHAKVSFVFSIVACSIGLLLLCVAVVVAVTSGWETATIPTVGSVLAEFIAATVFWVHKKSAKQLNRYYDSLHEVDVMVSAADMISGMTDENRDEAYLKILDELYAVQKIKAAKPDKYDKHKDK